MGALLIGISSEGVCEGKGGVGYDTRRFLMLSLWLCYVPLGRFFFFALDFAHGFFFYFFFC